MGKQRPWITYFSQTGGEIADLAESLGKWPTRIITNKRPADLRTIDPRIIEHGYIEISNNPTEKELFDILQYFQDPIITLHGWLRIMPEDICKYYEIYNGHPGLITEYPELKGKDPQIRAYEGKYPVAGAVLHRVTAGVDEGRIIAEEKFNADNLELDDLFRTLRDRSLYMWGNFLKKVI